jgi:hypothetical protein
MPMLAGPDRGDARRVYLEVRAAHRAEVLGVSFQDCFVNFDLDILDFDREIVVSARRGQLAAAFFTDSHHARLAESRKMV